VFHFYQVLESLSPQPLKEMEVLIIVSHAFLFLSIFGWQKGH